MPDTAKFKFLISKIVHDTPPAVPFNPLHSLLSHEFREVETCLLPRTSTWLRLPSKNLNPRAAAFLVHFILFAIKQ